MTTTVLKRTAYSRDRFDSFGYVFKMFVTFSLDFVLGDISADDIKHDETFVYSCTGALLRSMFGIPVAKTFLQLERHQLFVRFPVIS